LLTGPHYCQVCQGAINQPVGRRRWTILHHPDREQHPTLTDNCRTDVRAAIYGCPNCHVMLETPRYQWGRPVTCPQCHDDFRAPFDDLLHRHEGDAGPGDVFQFACPSCQKPLRCNTHREGQPTRDLPVVCVHCRIIITVPSAGQAVASPVEPPA
jgi:hypothetical protein